MLLNIKILLCIIFVSFYSLNIYAQKSLDYRTVILKKNDNISQIIYNHNLTPLYGKEQFLEKVLKLNRLSLEEAKKLNPGEVIIIPLKTYLLDEEYISARIQKDYIHKDEISEIKSSFQKELSLIELKPKLHNIDVKIGYFQRDLNHEGNEEKVKQTANFQTSISYTANNYLNNSNNLIFIKPTARLKLFSQGNAQFEKNDSLVADYNPSFEGSIGFTSIFQKLNMGIKSQVGLNQNSILTYDQKNEEYAVNDYQFTHIDLALTKSIFKNYNEYYINLGIKASQSYSFQNNYIELGTLIQNKYFIDLIYQDQSLKIEENINSLTYSDLGINFGYKF